MKKKFVIPIIGIPVLALLFFFARPFIFGESLVKTKELSTTDEIHQYINDSKILVPSYNMDENNPYSHTSKEIISLEKSKQYGQWDGYNIEIIPTKLSGSSFFQIFISSSKSIDDKNDIVNWRVSNANTDFQAGENYPNGEYTRVIGTLHQGTTQYEITGYAFGPIDDTKKQQLINELQYFFNSMK